MNYNGKHHQGLGAKPLCRGQIWKLFVSAQPGEMANLS